MSSSTPARAASYAAVSIRNAAAKSKAASISSAAAASTSSASSAKAMAKASNSLRAEPYPVAKAATVEHSIYTGPNGSSSWEEILAKYGRDFSWLSRSKG